MDVACYGMLVVDVATGVFVFVGVLDTWDMAPAVAALLLGRWVTHWLCAAFGSGRWLGVLLDSSSVRLRVPVF